MKKTELKNGAVVELRNGERYLKVDNTLLNIADFNKNHTVCYMNLDDYTEDLRRNFYNDKWDVVKANNNVTNCFGCLNNALSEVIIENKWTWERPATILDDVEKEYLNTICKRYKVNSIAKFSEDDFSEDGEVIAEGQYLAIEVINAFEKAERMYLPVFKANTMYKGMELCRKYTPEELGI